MLTPLKLAAAILRPLARHLPGGSAPGDRRPAPPTPSPSARPAAAARPPRPPSTKLQTLWCEAGSHEWQRPSAPGRKPTSCPDHA